jgi:hypothetical protein
VGKFFDSKVAKGAAGEDDDDDAGEDAGDEDDDEEEDSGEDDDEDAEGSEEGGEEDDDAGEDDAGDDDDEEDEDDDEEDDEQELDPSFQSAAAKHKLPTRFEDIVRTLPKPAQAKARAAFSTRLKEMESGLNRAFQDARSHRRTLATAKAEREWIDKNPVDHFLEVMSKDPKFVEQLNDELEKMETKAYAEAKTMRREDAKKEITSKAEAAEAAAQQRDERIAHVTSLGQRLSKAEGLPWRIAERALFVAITQHPKGDLTDAEIRQVIKDEAKELRRHTGERKREDRKDYVRDKHADRKAAARRPRGRDRGQAPAPGRVRPPKNLEEALGRAPPRSSPTHLAG